MNVVNYLVLCALFIAFDGLWIGVIADRFYKQQLKPILRDKPRWTPAVIFYVIYLSGLYVFALQPALDQQSTITALTHGAFLGFVAYSTYDLTNFSTLKTWTATLAIVDIAWGTILSGASVALTYLAIH